jgi:hypothetical protein
VDLLIRKSYDEYSNNNNNNTAIATPTRLAVHPRQQEEQQPTLIITNTVDFQNYLKAHNKRNINQILCYAQRFGSILESGDASLLLSLTPAVRRHAMEALTAYSKYTGTYQRWQEIRQAYLLKWANGNESLASLQRFFNQQSSLDHMIQKVKEMMRVLPKSMAIVIRHALPCDKSAYSQHA